MKAIIFALLLSIGGTLGQSGTLTSSTVGMTTIAGDNTTVSDDGPTGRQRLSTWIQSHDKTVRPVRHDATTEVSLGLVITNILDLVATNVRMVQWPYSFLPHLDSEIFSKHLALTDAAVWLVYTDRFSAAEGNAKTQELVMNVWLHMSWRNELLRWDPTSFDDLDSIKIPSDLIWLPDVMLYNSAEDYREEIDYGRYRALCYYYGIAFWSMPTRLTSTCAIDVTYFPFDSQHCHLRFGSWMYKKSEIDVKSSELGVDLANYVVSAEFELVSVHQKRKIIRHDRFFYGASSEMVYYIHLRRNTLYYLYTMIIPCLLISALTLLSFCLPPDSGEKIALGVTVLLAFSVFLMAVGDRLPETSESLPLIGVYLTVVMGMTSISVVMSVVVIRTDNTSTTEKRLPAFLRWLILDKTRRLLCMKLSHRRRRQGMSDTELVQPLMQLLRSTTANAESGLTLPPEQLRLAEGEAPDDSGGEENEWRKAARVVDRLLFWVFLVATVCVTLTFLVFIPIFARHPAVTDPDKLVDSLYGYTAGGI